MAAVVWKCCISMHSVCSDLQKKRGTRERAFRFEGGGVWEARSVPLGLLPGLYRWRVL